jgi:hypothetical protein
MHAHTGELWGETIGFDGGYHVPACIEEMGDQRQARTGEGKAPVGGKEHGFRGKSAVQAVAF